MSLLVDVMWKSQKFSPFPAKAVKQKLKENDEISNECENIP